MPSYVDIKTAARGYEEGGPHWFLRREGKGGVLDKKEYPRRRTPFEWCEPWLRVSGKIGSTSSLFNTAEMACYLLLFEYLLSFPHFSWNKIARS